MSENPNFIVELFIRTLEIKHKLTFQKDKQEYFRVLFDTYLNGQGNPEELKDYISAGIDDQRTVDTLADEVVQWQAKAIQMKAAEEAKKKEELAEKSKVAENAKKQTKPKDQHEHQRKEEHSKKRNKVQHKPRPEVPVQGNNNEPEVKGDVKGLKYELSQQGKQKCKFFPFCKNTQTCQYYHPTEKCTYFPKCRFGESCLYEHEACKFKEKCTKPNCPFAHPFRKSNPIEEMMKTFMSHHNPLSRQKKPYNPKNKGHEHAEPQGQPKGE